MKISITILTLVCIVFYSCKKELDRSDLVLSNYETIFPKSYYPVYPGSWWKYEKNNSEILMSSVSDEYQLHSYRTSENEAWSPATYSDSVYVPFLNSWPVYGYEKIIKISPPFGDYFRRWPILSETVGFTFQRNWSDTRFGDFSEQVEVTNKYFNGVDSVLVLEGHWINGPYIPMITYQEYVKGVGLTLWYKVNTSTNDTMSKKVLIDYFINE